MRLVSWNVNGRVSRATEQVKALAKIKSAVIALQEVTQKTAPSFRGEFQRAGYQYVADSFQRVKDKTILIGPRRYGEFIASRWTLRLLPLLEMPWTERVLSVVIGSQFGNIQFHNAHSARFF